MWKKIVAIVLLLALLGGGGFLIMKQRSVRQQEAARQQEIQRQMIPLQQEKRALLDQMQQLQRQYDGKMAQQATMQFVFTQLDERLYLEVFPAMLQNGIAGVMALSGEEYPGAPGRITSRQFDEMVRDGWTYCLQWDGSGLLWDAFTDVQWKMPENQIEMPDTVYLAPGVYKREMDATLTAQGIRMVIHHGEDGLPVDITDVQGSLWHLGAAVWKTESARQNLSANIENRGNLVFDVSFDSAYGTYSLMGFRDLMYATAQYQSENTLQVTNFAKLKDLYVYDTAYGEDNYRWLRKEDIVNSMNEVQAQIDVLEKKIDAISRGERVPETTTEETDSASVSSLENERMTLHTKMDRLDAEHPYIMAGRATVELLFPDLIPSLYSEIFPSLQAQKISGVMLVSRREAPGAEGRLTWDQYRDMAAHGWEGCLAWDGEGEFQAFVSDMKALFEGQGLEMPSALYAAAGAYTEAVRDAAAAAGFSVAVHHGETQAPLADYPGEGLWEAGCTAWNRESSAMSVLSPVVEEAKNLALVLRLDGDHPYMDSGLSKLLEDMQQTLQEGRIVFLPFGEARISQTESEEARTQVNQDRQEQLDALQKRLDEVEAQLAELKTATPTPGL